MSLVDFWRFAFAIALIAVGIDLHGWLALQTGSQKLEAPEPAMPKPRVALIGLALESIDGHGRQRKTFSDPSAGLKVTRS